MGTILVTYYYSIDNNFHFAVCRQNSVTTGFPLLAELEWRSPLCSGVGIHSPTTHRKQTPATPATTELCASFKRHALIDYRDRDSRCYLDQINVYKLWEPHYTTREQQRHAALITVRHLIPIIPRGVQTARNNRSNSALVYRKCLAVITWWGSATKFKPFARNVCYEHLAMRHLICIFPQKTYQFI